MFLLWWVSLFLSHHRVLGKFLKNSLLFQSQKQNLDISRQAKFAATPSFALFVNLKNVVCKIGEDAEVLMSLYDPLESKFIRSVLYRNVLFALLTVIF